VSDRTAVVTGGASGIGLAIAERLAADGAAVAIFDRDGGAADEAAAKIAAAGGTAAGLAVDVTDRPRIDEAVAEVCDRLAPPTILVNGAGLDGFDPFLSISAEKWQRILDVNLTGTFNCCQAVVPHMLGAGWGRIVNISSSSAQGGQQFMAHYVSSKAAMIGLTKSLALEFGKYGITANTIPPSFIVTPMLEEAASKGLLGPGGIEEATRNTPVGRSGQPEDIASACAFLVREDASYVSGQVIGVNGGRVT
jgi:2-hydroxycyclohexanecarboxyl-CoA dehydrogenase